MSNELISGDEDRLKQKTISPQERSILSDNKKEWVFFIIISIFVFVLVLSFNLILSCWINLPCPGTSGEFGDQFGVLNTLFTGLAFAGLIMTIILQRKDLALQRQEMRNAIIEQQAQTKQFEEQTRLQQKQYEESQKNFTISQTNSIFYNSLDHISRIYNQSLPNVQTSRNKFLDLISSYYNSQQTLPIYAQLYPLAKSFYCLSKYILENIEDKKNKVFFLQTLSAIFIFEDLVILNFMGYAMPENNKKIIEQLVSYHIFEKKDKLWGDQENLENLALPTKEGIINNR